MKTVILGQMSITPSGALRGKPTELIEAMVKNYTVYGIYDEL